VSDVPLRETLQSAVDEVLEKMFFLGTLEDFGDIGGDQISASMTFDGNPPGSMTLRIDAGAARSIAADFLGEEQSAIDERRMAEVVCELTNMICGSLLSKVEPHTTFRLNTPTAAHAPHVSCQPESECGEDIAAVYSGAMSITLRMGEPSCSPRGESAY
jgi:CheY-specific phosphatase CheX